MSVTIPLRTLVGFAAGAAFALIALFAFQAFQADAAPGDSDTTFVPVAPCRLIDTRPNVPGDPPGNVGPRNTPIGENSPVAFTAWGTGDANSTCDIPTSAAAISTNTTIVSPTRNSFLTLYPTDVDWPGTANLNYVAGEAPTPNAVTTPLSPTGQFNVYNRFGTVHVVVDVNGYYTKTSLQALQAEVTALKALTASMSKVTVDGQPTVRFSGVNVQVVSGSGGTEEDVNGRGNLIVGYNEPDNGPRTGSHNLVVGPYHSYSSYGGFVAGFLNTISGPGASVVGGQVNTASGVGAAILGGEVNTATGNGSTIAGGDTNTTTARAEYASITGGRDNRANGAWSSITGGSKNVVDGEFSSISGGERNRTGDSEMLEKGKYSSVSGGFGNNSYGDHSAVTGGRNNDADGQYSSVTGGTNNEADGDYDTVVGGDDINCDHAANIGFCGEGTIAAPAP